MKILSIEQIREADTYTIQHEPIASVDLMERAAKRCVNWIMERFDPTTKFKIICGFGNNGGDGLAIARLLTEKNYKVEVFIIAPIDTVIDKRSADFSTNYERLKLIRNDNCVIDEITSILSFQTALVSNKESVLVDALFGSGLNRAIEGLAAQVIDVMNKSNCKIISIDIPSGLYGDTLNEPTDRIISADYTLTFQFPKLSFMFPENADYIGEFTVLDIGLHPNYMDQTQTKNYFTTKTEVKSFLKTRSKAAHKGNFGYALIIAGSYGKMGAAVLSAKAGMHSGAGLLTVHIPKCGYEILQTTIPEVMCETDTETNFITDSIRVEKYNAIGIGPGIGTEKETQNVVKNLIQSSSIPLVFDADAINCIAENKTWLSFVPSNSIFTPHPKEFERLVGKAKNSMERLQLQRDFSIKYNAYVVLKGAHTSISAPGGDVFFNSTGNPGMATAGSGDVLTGIITSLLAQGYNSKQACILGVYLHGLAGDFASHEKTEESMIASDIIEHLSDAYKFLRM